MLHYLILFISIILFNKWCDTFDSIKAVETLINSYKEPPIFNNHNNIKLNNTFEQSKVQQVSKCCLAQKQFIPIENKDSYGKFIYKYTPLQNEQCNINNINNINNDEELINVNNSDECENLQLGSCSYNNRMCIDYVSQDFCNNYTNMIWHNKTCHA